MIKTSEFIKITLKDILNLPLVGKIYEQYGASPHIFTTYKDNNRLGKRAAEVLCQVIMDEIAKNNYKKIKILNFMQAFLSEKERSQFTNVCDIVPITISKFMIKRSSKGNNTKQLTDIRVSDLINRGWTVRDYVISCFKLWENITANDVPEDHGGTVDQWVEIVSAYPDTECALLNEYNDFVGFWYFKTLFDDTFSKMKAGEFLTNELSVDLIPAMIPGDYNIFVGVCLRENYRYTFAVQMMMFSILKAFEDLALSSVFIKEICAWAYTNDGIALCKTLGLKYLTDHKEHGKIYCGSIYNLIDKPICKRFIALKKLYMHHNFA